MNQKDLHYVIGFTFITANAGRRVKKKLSAKEREAKIGPRKTHMNMTVKIYNEDDSKLGVPVKYKAGVRTKNLKSSKLSKKRRSLLMEGKDKAETSASFSVAEDFVENQTSSLPLRFKANLGNSDSSHENLNLCAEKDQKSMKFNFFI